MEVLAAPLGQLILLAAIAAVQTGLTLRSHHDAGIYVVMLPGERFCTCTHMVLLVFVCCCCRAFHTAHN